MLRSRAISGALFGLYLLQAATAAATDGPGGSPPPQARSSTSTPPASTATPQPPPIDFPTLVRLADLARADGNLADARKAYLYALQLRPGEPTILGRLGLVAVGSKDWLHAARYLFEAVKGNGGTTDEEKESFGTNLVRARNQIASVTVTVNVLGASVLIDGEETPGTQGKSSFFVFVEPGFHEVHAEAKGYQPRTMTITAPRGGDVPLSIDLLAMPPAEVSPSIIVSPSVAAQVLPAKPEAQIDPSVKDEPIKDKPAKVHVTFGLGVAAGFFTVPGVGLGPVGSFDVRFPVQGVEFSVGLDFRAVRGLGTIKEVPSTRLWVLGPQLPVCAHIGRGFGCLFGQMENILDEEGGAGSISPPAFGGGVRGGAEFPLPGPLGVRLWADVGFRHLPLAYAVGPFRLFETPQFGFVLGGVLLLKP